MWRRASITSLFVLMTATRLDAADTVRIQVVALDDPSRGVRSTIFFDAQGGALPDRPTDRNGVATFSVEACDDSLGIFAEPALPYLNTARFDCARDLKIPVEKARYAAALEPGLREAASRSDWARYGQLDGGGGFFDRLIAGIGLKPEAYQVADPQAELTSALDDLRFADAARAAGTLATAARRADDARLAASYEAIAAAAAFRALGKEPGAPADPLLGVAADGAVTLTPAGKEVVAAFEEGAGLEPTGVWSPAALRALPSG